MKSFLVFLAAVICCTAAFDTKGFVAKYCKESKENITCSGFTWSFADRDDIDNQKFTISEAPAVFFNNVNIGVLNENLINKFPNAVSFSVAGGSFYMNSSVTSISATNTKLTSLTIRGVQILKNENSIAFSKLTNLKKLTIFSCVMNPPILDDVMVSKNVNLEELTFSQIAIGSVSPKALTNLVKLVKLDLTQLYLQKLDAKLLAGNVALKELSMNISGITSIPLPNFFPKTLQKLDLSGNSIRVLSANSFAGLISLNELNLNNNKLSVISPDAFKPMGPGLTKLYLAGDQTAILERQHFSNNVNLEELNLDFKVAQKFPNNIFDDLTKIQKINMIY